MLHFDPYFQHSVVGRSDFQEVFQRIDTCARFFVAHRAQPLGYVAFYCNDLKQQSAYLTMIGVAKASQHQGIGSRLLQEVEDVSRRYGMRTLAWGLKFGKTTRTHRNSIDPMVLRSCRKRVRRAFLWRRFYKDKKAEAHPDGPERLGFAFVLLSLRRARCRWFLRVSTTASSAAHCCCPSS